MQEKTLNYYRQKTGEALNYINNHLDEELNVSRLADMFCISLFHFHRIFKSILNEPLGSYIKRMRLDTSLKLLRYSEDPVKDIARKTGYNDLSAFSKAFSKEFGISPAEFRNDKSILLNTAIDYIFKGMENPVINIHPKFITLPDKEAAGISIKGLYGGPEVYKAWDLLGKYAVPNKLLGWKAELFSIYYDDPDVIPSEECRSDICIAIKVKTDLPAPIKRMTISGGKFAVFRYKGPYEKLWNFYKYIYGTWLMAGDIKLRNSPSLEKYISYSEKAGSGNYITEIYLPVE
jgi:AraC family transcriptional regulator